MLESILPDNNERESESERERKRERERNRQSTSAVCNERRDVTGGILKTPSYFSPCECTALCRLSEAFAPPMADPDQIQSLSMNC